MDRRTALATAGAITLVVLAGGAAIATNVELLSSATEQEPVGDLAPVDLSPSSPAPGGETTVVVEPSFPPGAAPLAPLPADPGFPAPLPEAFDPGLAVASTEFPTEFPSEFPTSEPTEWHSEHEAADDSGHGRGRGRGRGRGGDDDD